jgi:hypothetical protein
MKEIKYSAYFVGKGFYADYQPKYEWNFTDDLNQAKKYKTVQGVLDRLHCKDTTDSYDVSKYSAIIEEFETIKENDVITVKKTIVGKLDLLTELKRLQEERLERLKKKYPVVYEPLKVEILEIPTDDPYWD